MDYLTVLTILLTDIKYQTERKELAALETIREATNVLHVQKDLELIKLFAELFDKTHLFVTDTTNSGLKKDYVMRGFGEVKAKLIERILLDDNLRLKL